MVENAGSADYKHNSTDTKKNPNGLTQLKMYFRTQYLRVLCIFMLTALLA